MSLTFLPGPELERHALGLRVHHSGGAVREVNRQDGGTRLRQAGTVFWMRPDGEDGDVVVGLPTEFGHQLVAQLF